MTRHPDPLPTEDEAPLLSRRVLLRLSLAVAALLFLTMAISLGGRWLGQRMALGSHTESTQEYRIAIGDDTLRIAGNMIRFAEQRRDGPAESLDLYLTWPEMQGYSATLRSRFDDVSEPGSLLFLRFSESTMSRDMSGRVQPIYSHLYAGEPLPFDYGLTLHRLRADSGYGREVILTAGQETGEPYAVRCLLPAENELPTGGDCQRDIRVGQDLTVLYRFSSVRLADWQAIEAAVLAFAAKRIDPAMTQVVPGR